MMRNAARWVPFPFMVHPNLSFRSPGHHNFCAGKRSIRRDWWFILRDFWARSACVYSSDLVLTRFLIDVQVIVAELFKEIDHDINAVLDITWRWA